MRVWAWQDERWPNAVPVHESNSPRRGEQAADSRNDPDIAMKTCETSDFVSGTIETSFEHADATRPIMRLREVDAADTLMDGAIPPPPPFGVIVAHRARATGRALGGITR